MAHLDLATLQAGVAEIRLSPVDAGPVELIVRRPADDQREVLAEAELTIDAGLVGDKWGVAKSGTRPNRQAQLTLMNARAAALVADGTDHGGLAGDQLYVDLDLSSANIPPGTCLTVGSAVIEVTGEPHTGCGKFSRRFGVDALKFVNSRDGRALNLRGINAMVVGGGIVRRGDVIAKAPGARLRRSS
jgi:MOSC domain-containing protein YiiM